MTLRQLLSLMLVAMLLLVPAGGVLAQDGGPGAQATAAALGTGFTYQGRLDNGGTGVTNTCGFQFGLWDAVSAGAQVGITQTVSGVSVNAGYFTTVLNSGNEFGSSAFGGNARWLAIAVRCPDSGPYTGLAPRQALTPAPYALFAAGNWGLSGNAGTTTANALGTTDNMTLTLMVNGQTAFRLGPNATAVNVLGGAASNNIYAGVYGGYIGGGTLNVISPSVAYGVVAGGTQNRAGAFQAAVVAGQQNYADGYQSFIGGGAGNRTFGLNTVVAGGLSNEALATYATVVGGYNNMASGPGAFVGGGGTDGANFVTNLASGDASTVVGGYGNVISPTTSDTSFIGGGALNEINAANGVIVGGFSNQITSAGGSSFIGGGANNNAAAGSTFIGGGQDNSTGGNYAAVLGGNNNDALGAYSVVLGGLNNTANGSYSVALGYGAHANTSGSLVWTCGACPVTYAGNSEAAFFNSENGFWFGRNVSGAVISPTIGASVFISTSSGAYLSTSGVWQDVSDRNAKMNFAPVDGVAVLHTLMEMPIQTWTYKVEDPQVRHVGPMAQDFYAAFGLGDNDTTIGTVDADGVALASIQGLYTLLQAKEAEIAALKAAQAGTDARLAALEARAPVAGATGGASTLQLVLVLAAGMAVGAVIGAGAFALGRRAR